MAGSNSKEFRGLGANFWTNLQILLTRGGLRVESRKIEGLFKKNARRTGIFESGPLDLDRMARVGWPLDLIVAVGFGSGGFNQRETQMAAGRYRRRRIPRWRGSGLTGVHQERCSGGRFDPCLGRVCPARYA